MKWHPIIWKLANHVIARPGRRWFIYGRICREGALGVANFRAAGLVSDDAYAKGIPYG